MSVMVCPCCRCCLSVSPLLIYLRTKAGLPRDTTQRRADNNFYKQNKDKNSVVACLIIAAVKCHKINYKLAETFFPLSIPRPSPGGAGSSALKILLPVVTSNQYEDSGQVPRVLIASQEFE